MDSENSPPQSDNDELTTLGASEIGSIDDEQDDLGMLASDTSPFDPPAIDDVAGLEDLYWNPTDRDGFSPSPTQPGLEQVEGPPPLQFEADLQFSRMPPPPVPHRSVRSPGEVRTRPKIIDSIRDAADRRWFWTSLVSSGFAAVAVALVVAGLLSQPSAPIAQPNVVADGDAIDPRSLTTIDRPSESRDDSTTSSRFGNSAVGVDDSGVDSTTTSVEVTPAPTTRSLRPRQTSGRSSTTDTTTGAASTTVTTGADASSTTAASSSTSAVSTTTSVVGSTTIADLTTTSTVQSTTTTATTPTTTPTSDPTTTTSDPSSTTTDPSSTTTDPSTTTTDPSSTTSTT